MILHEKRYLIKAMKRNIKYLFDLFFYMVIKKITLIPKSSIVPPQFLC